GDINGDEEIDIFDLTLCMNHIVEKKLLEGIELEAADVNKDEEVDIFDLTRIMNYICEKIDTI
ncbi:dockerin type I repeat-containing protein, partial [Massilistercora timonensis]|uniref:dockerin type I repeat-containing protein n=1 Tax=Massilistercora timonensis TaxID=2086584 RepID=UPI003AB49E34